jgi:hypothetical protein
VSDPEKCDGSEEKDSEKMHGDWCRMQASGYPNMRCEEAWRLSEQDAWGARWAVGCASWDGKSGQSLRGAMRARGEQRALSEQGGLMAG